MAAFNAIAAIKQAIPDPAANVNIGKHHRQVYFTGTGGLEAASRRTIPDWIDLTPLTPARFNVHWTLWVFDRSPAEAYFFAPA